MRRLLLPHNVEVKKPTKSVDTATNIGSLNYAVPASVRSIFCKVDLQTANPQSVASGKILDRAGILFTRDSVVEEDDVFTWDGILYVINSVAKKYSHDGNYHHTECGFVRDIR